MAELKTKATTASVKSFLDKVTDPIQRQDSETLVALLQETTNAEPKMWGTAIVGFVDTVLKYESGRELDWFKVGFSPRKQNLTIYGLDIMNKDQAQLLTKLGAYTTGKGCLYIKKLSDVNLEVLKQIIKAAVK